MKESIKTVYKCDHCSKNYLVKHACVKHEKYCGKNPENHHACLSCKHLVVDRVQNDDGFNEKTFTCSVKELQLHSFKAEKIGHSCLGYTERMPLECDKHEDLYTLENISLW